MKSQNVLFFSAAFILLSCNRTNETGGAIISTDTTVDSTIRNQMAKAQIGYKQNEKTFILNASMAGMMEVELANIAIKKSQNKEVKAFAAQMISDHTKINTDLAQITKGKVEIAPTLSADQKKSIAILSSLSGRPFETQYVKMMLDDHIKAEQLFSDAAALKNNELRNFAVKTLPMIKMHYKTIGQIAQRLNIKNVNNGDDLLNISPDSSTNKVKEHK